VSERIWPRRVLVLGGSLGTRLQLKHVDKFVLADFIKEHSTAYLNVKGLKSISTVSQVISYLVSIINVDSIISNGVVNCSCICRHSRKLSLFQPYIVSKSISGWKKQVIM